MRAANMTQEQRSDSARNAVIARWTRAKAGKEKRTSPSAEDRDKFARLLASWHDERDTSSSFSSEIALCPSYQKIIGMGPVAIPLILSQLRSEGDEPDHWFYALRAISDADPVSEQDRGQISKMAAAWLGWGEVEGYAG